MDTLKFRFAKIIYQMNSALNTFLTTKEYEDLAPSIIKELVAICLPKHQVYLNLKPDDVIADTEK